MKDLENCLDLFLIINLISKLPSKIKKNIQNFEIVELAFNYFFIEIFEH